MGGCVQQHIARHQKRSRALLSNAYRGCRGCDGLHSHTCLHTVRSTFTAALVSQGRLHFFFSPLRCLCRGPLYREALKSYRAQLDASHLFVGFLESHLSVVFFVSHVDFFMSHLFCCRFSLALGTSPRPMRDHKHATRSITCDNYNFVLRLTNARARYTFYPPCTPTAH